LKYIVGKAHITQQNIATELDMGTSALSKYLGSTDGATLKLKKTDIYAILSVCGYPKEVFFNCNTINEIDEFIEELKPKNTKESVLTQLPKELKNLQGTSYLYAYNNNLKIHAMLLETLPQEKRIKINLINEVEISIDSFGLVTDQQNNMGKLIMLTENLSLIFIEDRNNKETTVYTFDNERVHLKQFLFGKRSKLNHSNEMLSFGFLSKEKLEDAYLEYCLDNPNKTQLKVSTEFLEKLSSYNDIEEF